MKTILYTTAAFLLTGAAGGSVYEAGALRQTHAQGFALALTDFTFEIIYAAVFGVIGSLMGLMVGTALYWFKRRSKLHPINH